jgi:hypothetical protein
VLSSLNLVVAQMMQKKKEMEERKCKENKMVYGD